MRIRAKAKLSWASGMVLGALAVLMFSIPVSARVFEKANPKVDGTNLAERVRHQLVMLPYYSVFDNLEFQVEDNGTVTLSGEVTRPFLKSDAVNVVRRLEGAKDVKDKIEVLPLSSYDDRLRIALYRRVFGNIQLDRYTLVPVPPIHIVVRNGNVTLAGVVASEADRNVAGIMANSVPGVFSVTNDLRVEARG